MHKRTILLITLLFALSLVAGACAPQPVTEEPEAAADMPLQVTVSILPQAYFVERIAGDLVSVNVMVGPGDDAHTYEPKPDQMIALSESALFFSIGIEYEDAWLTRFVETNPDMEIVDSSEGIERIMETIPHTHDHDEDHAHEGEHHHDEDDDHGHHDDHDHDEDDDHGHHEDHDHDEDDDHGHHDDHDHDEDDDHGHHDDHDHDEDDDHGHHDDHDHDEDNDHGHHEDHDHDEDDDHGHHDDHDHDEDDDHGHHDDHDHDEDDDHGHHHDHDHELGLDPHVWLTPANGEIIARNIYQALVSISPENEAIFSANLESFVEEIQALDSRITETLSGAIRRSFMVYHPAWGYFADAYRLTQLPIQAGGTDPSARELAALIDEALEEDITVIFVQPQFSEANARAIAQEINGEVIQIDPLAFDWLANLESVADAFARALGN